MNNNNIKTFFLNGDLMKEAVGSSFVNNRDLATQVFYKLTPDEFIHHYYPQMRITIVNLINKELEGFNISVLNNQQINELADSIRDSIIVNTTWTYHTFFFKDKAAYKALQKSGFTRQLPLIVKKVTSNYFSMPKIQNAERLLLSGYVRKINSNKDCDWIVSNDILKIMTEYYQHRDILSSDDEKKYIIKNKKPSITKGIGFVGLFIFLVGFVLDVVTLSVIMASCKHKFSSTYSKYATIMTTGYVMMVVGLSLIVIGYCFYRKTQKNIESVNDENDNGSLVPLMP